MKNKITGLLFFTISLFSLCLNAQQGKDGIGNINVANTIVNLYTPLTVSVTAGATSITVGSVAGFSIGDLVYIIQMQGATVNAHIYIYGDPNASLPGDTSSGKITAYNDAGNNEFAEITSISGNNITLDCALKNKYGDSLGGVPVVQVIRVKRYSLLTISSPGTITCPTWNGTTGGVVAIEVQGTTTIGAGASIDVIGKGFRGGSVLNATGFGVSNQGTNYGSPGANGGGHKGESIVGDTNVYKRENNGNFNGGLSFFVSCPLALCKANVANGGGGGNAMNCGGGGGSNGGVIANWNGMGNPDNTSLNNTNAWSRESLAPVNGSFRPTSSSGGGRGGYAFSTNNADPTAVGNGPNSNAVWGSDSRHNDGGWGGTPLDYSTGKIFLGGGGGAGDSNDGNGSSGGNGGGLVYLLSYGTISGTGQILANGATASNTDWNNAFGKVGDDGAGGGGGGGTVFISSSGAISLTNPTPISAQGGVGGNYKYHGASTNHNYGPGGGGGGGYVATSNAVTNNINGGANGIVAGGSGNGSKIEQNFPPNGATAGGAGTSATSTTFYLTATNYTICSGSSASLTVTANGTGIPNPISYNWYNASAGGSPVFTGNPYNTGALTVGTYTYYAGTCPGTYRIPVIVNVLNAPTVTVAATPTVVCASQTTTLTASGASSYTWSANAGSVTTATTSVSPVVNTTYTVTGANGTCTDIKTITVTVSATPTVAIAASNTTICSGSPVTFTASGASTYTWSANAGGVTTASATASPTVTTIYTVTGSNGGTCNATQTVSVNVTAIPTVTVAQSNTTICSGSAVTFTASGATTYTWSANAGSVITTTAVASPTVTTTYTVTGANGICASTQTVSVNVTTTPTITIAQSNTVICSGSAVTFTALGATTYTWSANAGSVTTATASASPTTTDVYTVTGVNGICTSTQTVSVIVTATPTVTAVSSPTIICNGSSAILTASGATSYTWSANAGSVTTATASVSPIVNTTYAVTGANGICIVTQTVSVTVSATPTITIAQSNTIICSNSAVTFTASGATTYTWSVNAGSATTSSVSVFPITNTTYTVTGDNGGCPATQTVSVNVTVTPTITVVPSPTIVCNGSGVILTASGATSYTWSANAGSVLTATASVSPTTNTTYTVTGANGICIGTQTVLVNVTTTPMVTTAQSNTVICSGSVITFTASGATTYTWSANAGSVTTSTVSVSPITNTTYTVIGDNGGGCTSTQTVSVIVMATPTVIAVSSNTIICNGSNAILTASGATSYTWSANAGSVTTATASVSPTTTDVYTVTGANGICIVTQTVSVTVSTTPTITIAQSNTVICSGSAVTFTASGATTYTWSVNAGSATTSTVSVFPITNTTFSVIGDNGGCPATETVSVNVTITPTVTAVSSSTIICNGSSAILTANGATSYTWSANAGSVTTATASVSPTVNTTYTLTGANGICTGTQTVSVTVSPVPSQPPVVISPEYYCLYQNALPLNATTSGGATLNWFDASGNLLPGAPTPATSSLGTTTYYVTQSIGLCSSGKDSIKVIVVTRPNATFVTNPTTGNILAGQTVVFTPNQLPAPYLVYAWSFGEPSSSTNTSFSVSPTHAYGSQGTYCPTLTIVSSQTGCRDSSTSCVEVLNGINVTIPNIFTPNGDNINDVFSVKSTGISTLTCNIFDRWGLKLYDWNGTAGFWDGTDSKNGKTVTDGTYYYIIEATDIKKQNHKYQGYIQLIK